MMANYIGGKISATNGVIHLLTEYNTETGLSLTATSIYQPENFAPFMRWAWARINSVSDLMEDKTRNFQLQITGKISAEQLLKHIRSFSFIHLCIVKSKRIHMQQHIMMKLSDITALSLLIIGSLLQTAVLLM